MKTKGLELADTLISQAAYLYRRRGVNSLTLFQRATLTAMSKIFWDYLAVQDTLQKADAMMLFGSSSMKVPAYAADLYKLGYAPIIIVCGARGRGKLETSETEAKIYSDLLLNLGIPKEVIIMEDESKNTGENVRFGFKRLFDEKGVRPKSVILITRPPLQRRAWRTAMRWFPEVNCYNAPADEQYFTNSNFDNMHRFMLCYGEIKRLHDYVAEGYTIPQEIPENIEVLYRIAQKHLPPQAEIDPEFLTD